MKPPVALCHLHAKAAVWNGRLIMSPRPTGRVPARRGERVAGLSPPASPGWVCVRAGRTDSRSSAVRNPRGDTSGLNRF